MSLLLHGFIPWFKRKPRGRHTTAAATAAFHIGVTPPGHFPWREQNCTCKKAPCGLVVNDPTDCGFHDGTAPIRQFHAAEACTFQRSFT